MIELGSSPELREMTEALQALTQAVGSLTEIQAKNTKLLEYLASSVAREPEEGEDLQGVIEELVQTLRQLPAKVEAAVARGIQAG